MLIAVDFDGTIVEHRFPMIGKPLPMAFDTLKALQADGHILILWTNREDKYLQEAVDFCHQNGVDFFAVNSMYPDAAWTGSGVSRKISADIYIDDKNLGGLPSWDMIYETIKNHNQLLLDKQKSKSKQKSSHKKHHHSHGSSTHQSLFKMIAERCSAAKHGYRLP